MAGELLHLKFGNGEARGQAGGESFPDMSPREAPDSERRPRDRQLGDFIDSLAKHSFANFGRGHRTQRFVIRHSFIQEKRGRNVGTDTWGKRGDRHLGNAGTDTWGGETRGQTPRRKRGDRHLGGPEET